MVKAEIQLERSPPEIIGALRHIAGNHNAGPIPTRPELRQEPPASKPAALFIPVAPVTPQLVAANWTLDYALEFLADLHPESLQVIKRIHRALSYWIHRDRLAQDLGIRVEQVRKKLVSAGHARHRIHEAHSDISLPRPVKYHTELQTYSLDESFAEVFGETRPSAEELA